MKKTLISILAVATAAAVFVPAISSAADGPGRDHPRMRQFARRIAQALDLTEDQRQALKDVVRMHQPVLQPLRQQARNERQSLRALITADQLDETALATQAGRIADTQKQIVIASAHLRVDLRKILTPDQLGRIEAWRGRAENRFEGSRLKFLEILAETEATAELSPPP
jgi:Spy/CpxP family protein refolding chaperone